MNNSTQSPAEETPLPTQPQPTATVTSTPVPLAMKINDVGIALNDYEAQLVILRSALQERGDELSEQETQQLVVDYLVELELLAQSARAQGRSISTEELDQKVVEFAANLGGEAGFESWLAMTGYSREAFRVAYQRELEAAWQRDNIASQVKENTEQVQARQILVFEKDLAQQIYQRLQLGADFATLAEDYDPVTKGDLGWFPRGYLFHPEIEEAVFMLLPGQYTEVIETSIGFHIVQVIAREESHPLSSDARLVLVRNALKEWLDYQRTHSRIEMLIE